MLFPCFSLVMNVGTSNASDNGHVGQMAHFLFFLFRSFVNLSFLLAGVSEGVDEVDEDDEDDGVDEDDSVDEDDGENEDDDSGPVLAKLVTLDLATLNSSVDVESVASNSIGSEPP